MVITAAENWCFVSGRCASIEGSLLGAEFFRGMLRQGTADGAFGRLTKSPYGGIFPHLRSLYDYDAIVSNHLRSALLSIQRDSPMEGPAEIFLRELDLRDIHAILIRQGGAREKPGDMESWATRLGAGFPWLGGFEVAPRARVLFSRNPVRALSLWVDGAYLREAMRLASVESALGPYCRALVSLRTVEACWRAMRCGLEPEWLAAFFFGGGLQQPPCSDAVEAAKVSSFRRLLCSFGLSDINVHEEDLIELYPRYFDDYLTNLAAGGKYDIYGAGRVLYFLRRVWVEHFNLRLCLAAVLTPLPSRQAEERLRHD
jgi:vacuolar-type H+-ATPase subunit C/Vma6